MPKVMAALPNIGGALCSTPQSLADARVSCSNAAKTRNPLKLPGVPQTNETISGPHLTQSRLWAEAYLQPFGRNKHIGPKIGGSAPAPFGEGERPGSPSNTKSPGPRPTSIRSDIFDACSRLATITRTHQEMR